LVKGCAYHLPVELRQLRYFVAVAEELHFRRAAERLYVSQPSVSEQIRTLEAELGLRLFDRNRRGVALTPAGEALLNDARDLLARADRASERARAAGGGEIGTLRLSLTRSLTGGLASEIVDAFRARYPGIQLDLNVGYTSLHIQQLRARQIDLAFVRPPVEDPDLEELEFAREPLICVLPSHHRLAARRRIRPRDLLDEPLVWWPREHGPRPWRQMLGAVYGEDAWPELARTEPEEERIVSAVADGAGVSFIMLQRSRSLRVHGAVYRRFAEPEPTAGIALAWRKDNSMPAITRLREVATEVAAARGGAAS
jgi:DNA-binding transcriptional LysR family regulator